MKNLILAVAIALTATMTAQTEREGKSKKVAVPANVREAFAKKYPTVKKVKWEKEDGNYEAGFDFNKAESSVLIDVKGNILETESEIEVSTLSKSITDYVAKNYPKQKIKDAAKIVNSNNKVTYEAEVNGLDLLFDENGNFIKATKD